MSHIPKVMDAFAKLLAYPDEHTAQVAELLYIVLQGEVEDAASDISQFGAFLEQHEPWQVEEAFTGTFDVNPECALEVGWHLFGEEYARGTFLVRMREELRKYGLPESTELPDHIAHVLAIVASMPDDRAATFVTACVQPAVEKLNDALAKRLDTPYRHVVSGLAAVIKQKWGAGKSGSPRDVLQSRSPQTDLLRAFPVADSGCDDGCGGSCSEPDVVQLEPPSPAAVEPLHSVESLKEDRS